MDPSMHQLVEDLENCFVPVESDLVGEHGELFDVDLSDREMADRIHTMLVMDRHGQGIVVDYIERVQKDGMNPSWRKNVCEWLLEFVEEFNVSIDIVACAVHYMDQYLSKKSTKGCLLQLVALASILVASKFHDAGSLNVKELQPLAEGVYQESDIRLMELELLRTIDWNVNPTTSYSFLGHLVQFFGKVQSEELYRNAEILLDLALMDYSFLKYTPSQQASAALICTFSTMQIPWKGTSWQDHLSKHAIEIDDNVLECHHAMSVAFNRFHTNKGSDRSDVVVSPDCVSNASFLDGQ